MKLLLWFVKIVLIVMLVSSLTLLTTGLIVQSYAKSLLASFNIQWEGQSMGLLGMFQGALGSKSDLSTEGEKKGNAPANQPTGAEKEQAPENSISVMGNANGTKNDSAGVDAGKESTPEASNAGAAQTDSNSGAAAGSDDAIVVSPDDITGAKNKLPTEEKERIFTLLMNKLPQKEMQQISGAMEGGLTEQELREIEQVISKYLTSEEYNSLIEVLQSE
ncbi:hypothetical protein HUB98_16880 [Paenibacillus barcinonensis]|uniref:Uncharacterized protein n=1 Tax=Paenibacillus barcinonensis TaxID=198119 RepID=A0A2V4V9L5_PAEBA|nr:hypothetical protein [Paenibacillus barcinonensis]PYE48761.1 hypothetical protein DFQ00_10754 [Paenibacillus barcinonensis]QKS57809.1 hypothetical protein HUB98_16880 [Paenibacillus barcinonensis]